LSALGSAAAKGAVRFSMRGLSIAERSLSPASGLRSDRGDAAATAAKVVMIGDRRILSIAADAVEMLSLEVVWC